MSNKRKLRFWDFYKNENAFKRTRLDSYHSNEDNLKYVEKNSFKKRMLQIILMFLTVLLIINLYFAFVFSIENPWFHFFIAIAVALISGSIVELIIIALRYSKEFETWTKGKGCFLCKDQPSHYLFYKNVKEEIIECEGCDKAYDNPYYKLSKILIWLLGVFLVAAWIAAWTLLFIYRDSLGFNTYWILYFNVLISFQIIIRPIKIFVSLIYYSKSREFPLRESSGIISTIIKQNKQ